MQAREQRLDVRVAGVERTVALRALEHALARDVEVCAHLPLRALGELLVGARRQNAGLPQQFVKHCGGGHTCPNLWREACIFFIFF